MVISKLAEPITLFTDGILTIQCLYYAIRLWSRKKVSKNINLLILGVLDFIFIAGFSFFGAISHYTSSDFIFNFTWPIALILGGCALCIFQILLTRLYISFPNHSNEKIRFQIIIYSVPIAILLIYISLNASFGWNFNFFSAFFLLDCIYFFILLIIQILRKKNEWSKEFNRILIYYLFWILIIGIIQLVGKIFHWQILFGSENQYLLQFGNEISHICLLYANFILYRGIQNHFFNKST